MNIYVLIVAIVMAVAVVAHLIGGTRETASLAPDGPDPKRRANWVQAMCAFQMLSVDLILVTALLFAIALTDMVPYASALTLGLAALFAVYGVVWIVQMLAVRARGVALLRLPHFIIWFVLAGLLWLGA